MNEVIQFLIEQWKFDMWVFSQWWLYAPLAIPACFYLSFFFTKWAVLTAPIWIPISIVARVIRR